MGHGLGFSNLVDESNGSRFMDFGDLYSQYTLDDVTDKNWNAMTNAERQASAINLRNVSWTGLNVKKDVPKVLSRGDPHLKGNTPAFSGEFLFSPASFGPALTSAGTTGDVVLGDDGVLDPGGPSTTNGCTPLTNPVAGRIVLLDRGLCGFTVKVKNAQDAGAIGVLIADNVAGAPPPGLGGADPTITIPSGRITLADGNALKAALTSANANVTMSADKSMFTGTDRNNKLMMLATFNPVALGSSISHYDGLASRNQLMEPAINADLTASVTPPEDLSTSLFTDLGWYSDADGVPDGTDSCIGSDTRPTVVLGSCDSRAGNDRMVDGCSVSDRLDECTDPRPAHYLACIAKKTEQLRRQRVIQPLEEVGILLCAVKKTVHP